MDFGKKKGKKGKKGRGDDDDWEDAAADAGAFQSNLTSHRRRRSPGPANALRPTPGEAEEEEDFGKKKGKDKKGKKGGKAAAADDDDDDFDFGAKGKKGKDKKGGKAADVTETAMPEAGAPKVVCTVLDVRPHVDAKKLQVCTVYGGDDVGTVQV